MNFRRFPSLRRLGTRRCKSILCITCFLFEDAIQLCTISVIKY
jgi:hypothetical protein